MLHQRFMSENIKNGVFLVLLHFFLFPGYFNKFRHVRFLFAVDGSNSSDHHFRLFRLIVRHKPAKALRNYTVKKPLTVISESRYRNHYNRLLKDTFCHVHHYSIVFYNKWMSRKCSILLSYSLKILYNWCSWKKTQWNTSKGSTTFVKQFENSSQNSK